MIRVLIVLAIPLAVVSAGYAVAWFRARWGLRVMRRQRRLEEQRLDAAASWNFELNRIANETADDIRRLLELDSEGQTFFTADIRERLEAAVNPPNEEKTE